MNGGRTEQFPDKLRTYSLSTLFYIALRQIVRIFMRVFFSLEYDGLHYIREQEARLFWLVIIQDGWIH